MKCCKTLVLVAALGLVQVHAQAEPQLPGGLDEPQLPGGLADESFDDDFWGDDEQDESREPFFNGFWELRIGQRLQTDPNQRDASLAEARLELERDWQWGGWSFKTTTDFVYDDIEDSHHNDLESGAGWLDLRELWVERRLAENLDVKAGRQILTWGVGDLVFINDLFPKDWNSFLAGRDEQYLKAPSDAFRLGFYSELVNINLIYTPRFDADRYIDGRRLSYFSPLAGEIVGQNGLLAVDRPDHSGEDDELAVRLYRRVGSYEVALYGYRGFWKSPAGFDPFSGDALFPELQVLGGSVRGALGPGIVSAEVGFYDSREDSDGSDPFINNDEFRALASYEWEVARDTTLNLQYYLEVLGDYNAYRDSLLPGQQARDHYRQLLTARLTRLALNQNLTLSLFVFYSPTDSDAYLRPNVHYKISDDWAVEMGANLFTGEDEHSFFGQFEDNTNLYASVRFSF